MGRLTGGPASWAHPVSTGAGHNLAATIEATARAQGWGARTAFLVDATAVSHDEVHDGAARAAAVLAGLGVGCGDVVLIVLPDGIEFVWSFLGAVRLGALALPVNPELTTDDHLCLAQDSGAGVVVCSDELRSRFDGGPQVVTAPELLRSLALVSPHPAIPVDAGAPAYAQYTSGTTGAPKAAVHRHGDPLVYTRAFAHGAITLAPDDVVHSVSKMYFAYGLGNSLFFPLLCGARAVLLALRPRPAETAALVERHQVSVLFAVPTFYANLVRECAPAADGAFGSVRVAVSAGERLTTDLATRASRLLACPVLDGLGSTEVGQTFASNTADTVRPGTVGRALPPYELAVCGRDATAVAPGEVGALWVRGPTVLLEYLGRPDAATTDDEGWLRTEDLASVGADGFVQLHGRADDMEMVGGISVAPAEIEELLGGHDAVSEVAVVAVTDAGGASRLRAFVVPAVPGSGDDSLAEELTALARARLAPFKVPRSVAFVDGLPRTPTGKLRRFVLRSGAAGPVE